MRIYWTSHARMDQLEIYETIAEDSSDAAERVYQQIEARVAMLAHSPRLGVRRPELGRSVRMLVQGVYLIYYEMRPDTDQAEIDEIEVLRMIHGSRDMRK